jgi:hypothetical protein
MKRSDRKGGREEKRKEEKRKEKKKREEMKRINCEGSRIRRAFLGK